MCIKKALNSKNFITHPKKMCDKIEFFDFLIYLFYKNILFLIFFVYNNITKLILRSGAGGSSLGSYGLKAE